MDDGFHGDLRFSPDVIEKLLWAFKPLLWASYCTTSYTPNGTESQNIEESNTLAPNYT